jgi:HEAT repeat protein
MAPPLPPLPQSPPQALPNELRQGAAPLGPSPQGPSATDAGSAAAIARRLGRPAKAVTQASSSDDIRSADSFDLMWQSQGGDEEAAARATAELQRRGCTEVHLELARRLFDRDPEVRKELARALPKLRSVDPGPWLLRLARDEEAEVRLTALALMATTGDPALLEPAEGLARQDSDPRIREQAQRIGRQRELTVGRGESRKGALR